MKPEQSEKLLIKQLFEQSKIKSGLNCTQVKSVERLTGDASTRKYYRVFCDQDTYVVCLDNPMEKSSFVDLQQFFASHGVRVPCVIDCNLSSGYILEEDLGDETLLSLLARVEDRKEELKIYKSVIDELAKIHNISKEEIKKHNVVTEAFDFKKLSAEIDFTIDYFLERFLLVDDKILVDEVKSEFYKICLRASEVDRVCTHRDFHSRNIMNKKDELIIIDFQDARMGLPQYDLASLLDDCYYEIDEDNKKKLMEYYFEKVSLKENFETFLANYNDIALQRVFKAIGSFSYIYFYRKDHRYLKYIGFAMEKLKAIMMKNVKYEKLRKALMTTYYEK